MVFRQQYEKYPEGRPLAATLSARVQGWLPWGPLRKRRQPVGFGVHGVQNWRAAPWRRHASSCSVVKYFIRAAQKSQTESSLALAEAYGRTGVERSHLQAPTELLPREHTGGPLGES